MAANTVSIYASFSIDYAFVRYLLSSQPTQLTHLAPMFDKAAGASGRRVARPRGAALAG
jgi:hypothetical protein